MSVSGLITPSAYRPDLSSQLLKFLLDLTRGVHFRVIPITLRLAWWREKYIVRNDYANHLGRDALVPAFYF